MPKRVDEQEQIARIVHAVCTVLAARGLDGLNLRAVAQEAGCTTGLLMHWFPSKADLVQAALARTVAAQNARVTRRLAANPGDVLGALAEFLPVDSQRQAESRIRLSFLALAVSTPTLMADHRQRYAMFRREIITHLKEVRYEGASPSKVADRIIVLVDGICVGATLDPLYWTPRRQRAMLAANITDVAERTRRVYRGSVQGRLKRVAAKRRRGAQEEAN